MTATFKVEKVANMVFVTKGDVIFKAWSDTEFTERKLSNWVKKQQKNYLDPIVVERTF